MDKFNNAIIGGGLSSLIRFYVNPESAVFSIDKDKIIKNYNFYENLKIGGNSNLWAGYINAGIFYSYFNNKNFLNFMNNQNLFKLRKLFVNQKYSNTYYISNYSDLNILRINENHFKNSLHKKKIIKLDLKNKDNIYFESRNEKFSANNLSLCVGNLSLIKLLFNSNLITYNDKISFLDGKVSYGLSFLSDNKNEYCIPMSILEIIEKILFKKSKYNSLKFNTLFVQKFSKKYKKYNFSVHDIIKKKKYVSRYFNTHHTTNLTINDLPINSFIKKFNKNIHIYNSGAIKDYLPGPISQNLIFNAVTS